MYISNVTQKGQATIPVFVRNKLGIKPNGKVVFEQRGETFIIRPIEDTAKLIDNLYGSLKTNIKWDKKRSYSAVGKMLAERHLKTLK